MLELLAFPFFQRALIVGLILGALMAALGVFVVLRRMSFFADAIGHSALTGIALGLLLGVNPFLAALAFSLLIALAITGVRAISRQSFDTLLGVFIAATVSVGVIIVSRTPGYQTDLINILFGDILTVAPLDVTLSLLLAVVIAIILFLTGKALVSLTFDASLARAEGIPTHRHELTFLLLLAATIALSIKFIGVILVTALLITPAAAAQNLARSLSSMFVWAVAIALISVGIG
ncbi:MAG: metal ABC transporter permease, partial [Patescibacteria group bacterium]